MTDDAGLLKGWLPDNHWDPARKADAAEPNDNRGAQTEEISKKNLLKATGLSYGQLYRWKRMGLIPENWFVRRATYTGQETFFPRRHILERIETIQRLMDRYTLEEIAELLSPAASGRRYSLDEIQRLDLCPPEGLSVLAAVYETTGRQKRDLSPELRALLAPPGVQSSEVESRDTDAFGGPEPPPPRASHPTSYSFLDLVAGTLAVELLRRGLSSPVVQGGIETLLAGAAQFSSLDDVHLVCAQIGDPPVAFSALYSGHQPVVFGSGVVVTADIAVGPIADSLRQSLKTLYE